MLWAVFKCFEITLVDLETPMLRTFLHSPTLQITMSFFKAKVFACFQTQLPVSPREEKWDISLPHCGSTPPWYIAFKVAVVIWLCSSSSSLFSVKSTLCPPATVSPSPSSESSSSASGSTRPRLPVVPRLLPLSLGGEATLFCALNLEFILDDQTDQMNKRVWILFFSNLIDQFHLQVKIKMDLCFLL